MKEQAESRSISFGVLDEIVKPINIKISEFYREGIISLSKQGKKKKICNGCDDILRLEYSCDLRQWRISDVFVDLKSSIQIAEPNFEGIYHE